MFRIRDIFVRIQIRGSGSLTNGSVSWSFPQWSSRHQQNIFFFLLFCLLLFEFTSFFKEKKVFKKSWNSRNRGFSYNFGLIMEGSEAVPLTNWFGSGSGRPKNLRILIQNTGVGCFCTYVYHIQGWLVCAELLFRLPYNRQKEKAPPSHVSIYKPPPQHKTPRSPVHINWYTRSQILIIWGFFIGSVNL